MQCYDKHKGTSSAHDASNALDACTASDASNAAALEQMTAQEESSQTPSLDAAAQSEAPAGAHESWWEEESEQCETTEADLAHSVAEPSDDVCHDEPEFVDFEVSFPDGVHLAVPPGYYENLLGNLPGSGNDIADQQFLLQFVSHIGSVQSDKALQQAVRSGNPALGIKSYSGNLSPTLANTWAGAVDSTKLNMAVFVTVKLADGSLAKLDAEQLATTLAWETGKSLIAESAGTAVASATTLAVAAKGGAIGGFAGPIGIAVGFAAGAAIGVALDYVVTDKVIDRVADVLGSPTGRSGRVAERTSKVVEQQQKLLDDHIRKTNTLVANTEEMENQLNLFQDALVGLDADQQVDGFKMHAANRGTFGNPISHQLTRGLSALNTVRPSWSLTRDDTEVVSDWAHAKNMFQFTQQSLGRAMNDAIALRDAAFASSLHGPDARPNTRTSYRGKKQNLLGRDVVVETGPDDDWSTGVGRPASDGGNKIYVDGVGDLDPGRLIGRALEYHSALSEQVYLLTCFVERESILEPLEKQLEKTYGFGF